MAAWRGRNDLTEHKVLALSMNISALLFIYHYYLSRLLFLFEGGGVWGARKSLELQIQLLINLETQS